MMPLGNAATSLLAVAMMACFGSYARADSKPACGAVSADGRFAAALLDAQGLDLEILLPDGTAHETHLAHEFASALCWLSFDRQGQNLGVAVRMFDKGKTQLRLAVFDTHADKWINSFDVNPEPDFPFPVRFEGFLGDSSNLVVTGFANGTYHKPEKSAVRVAVFSLDGRLIQPVLTRDIPGSYFNWDVDFADVGHNRLWFNQTPLFCPLGSATLTGPFIAGPTVEKSVLGGLACDLLESNAFPDDKTLLGASVRSDNTWVWRVDLSNGDGEKLELPEDPRGGFVRWNQYQISGEHLPVSPDGQICAVARAVVSWNALDQPNFKSGSVFVMQVRPLRLISILRPSKDYDLVALAVDHRNGQITVLNHRRGGGWKLVPVPPDSFR